MDREQTQPSGLAAALAEFQAQLPQIAKGEIAEVEGTTKSGKQFKYKYAYADLADVSKMVLPLLGSVGLSWMTRPTLSESGRFVLAYELLHVSGESRIGEYPLPSADRSPQDLGSAITYARRYALCSVTGVAPEADDDDGASASRRPRGEPDERDVPEAELATAVQMDRYRELRAAVVKTTTRNGFVAGTRKVREAFTAGELTIVHANELAREIERRLAALPQEEESADLPVDPPMSKRTQGRLFALFAEVGLDGDENQQNRRDYAAQTLGVEKVESVGALTEPQARRIIAALEKAVKDEAKRSSKAGAS